MAEDEPPGQARGRLTPAQELAAVKAELELFTAGAAHDLQQPLRQIIAVALRLGGRVKGSRAPAADVRRIVELAQGMRSLVDYLVAYQQAGATTLDIGALDAREAVDEVLAELRPRIESQKARLTVGALPVVLADAIQLRQALHHLLDNALKFHRPGAAPVVRVGGRRRGLIVEISVEDEGIGIEPRYFDKIFEPFERLNCAETYPGSGLGLPICRKIAERHEGSITVSSEPGRGSRFTLLLPAP